jgi:ABC-type transporter Mla subunit MlaD
MRTILNGLLVHHPARDTVAERVKDYFTRQIAWFESLLAELDAALAAAAADPELRNLAQTHAAHVEATARFEDEFRSLVAAWRTATDVSQAQRDEIRLLARRAEALAARLGEAYQRAMKLVDTRAERVRETLHELARGHDLLRKYHQGHSPDAWFIDKRA